MNILFNVLKEHSECIDEIIACFTAALDGDGKFYYCYVDFLLNRFTLFFTETNALIAFNRGVGWLLSKLTLTKIRDEDFCENTSTIIENIAKLLKTYKYESVFNNLFQELNGLSVVLEVLKKHYMNQVICNNLVHVIKAFFSGARYKKSFGNVALILKDINIELVVDLINNMIKEHVHNTRIVFSCVATFRELSDYKGKQQQQQQHLLK